MSSFFETSVPKPARTAHYTPPEEQTTLQLDDARRARREKAARLRAAQHTRAVATEDEDWNFD